MSQMGKRGKGVLEREYSRCVCLGWLKLGSALEGGGASSLLGANSQLLLNVVARPWGALEGS